MPIHGWDAVTVPGAVSAWVALSERFGKLPFEALFEPAIGYAERGFLVSPVIGKLWARAAEVLHEQPGFAECFLPGEQAPQPGQRFASPGHARALRLIAESKGQAFYEGVLAEEMVAHAQANGGAMVLADLAEHRADWCGTISRRYCTSTLHEIPPNGQGIAALMTLGILEHTPLAELNADDPLAWHLQIEATKLALRDTETYVTDEAHMTRVSAKDLLSDDYLAARAKEIDPMKAHDTKAGAPKQGGTVYLTAADSSGMMVSFIQSNYMGFGSGIVVPNTGISLQNRGAGFSLDPENQNVVAPGKRPFQTIIPGFLMGPDGAPLMSFGVMGGPMQAQGHVQMMLRTQLWGQDPQMAVDAPRWRVTEGLGVACETSVAPEILRTLTAMGHQLNLEPPDAAFGFGGAQLIRRLPGGGYVAGSDPRKDGCAVGF